MKLGVLFSGGKDSNLAMLKAMDFHEVCCLISIFSKSEESYMFHVPNIQITNLQAKAIGLPLIKVETKGEKEKEVKDLEKAIKIAVKKFRIEGVATGAIKSIYQAERIQKVCDALGLWCFNPLWQEEEEEEVKEILSRNFEVIISGVFAYPFTKDFLGRRLDFDLLKELKQLNKKYGISIAGEGGEFETTVLDAPFYKKRIQVVEGEVSYSNYSGVFKIKKAKLVEK